MSTIITQDEYSVSKVPLGQTEATSNFEIKPTTEVNHQNLESQLASLELSSHSLKTDSEGTLEQSKGVSNEMIRKDDLGIQELFSSFRSGLNINESKVKEVTKSHEAMLKSSIKYSGKREVKHHVSMSERQCDFENNESEEKLIQLIGENTRVATYGDAYASNLHAANTEEKSKVEKETRLSKNKLKSSLKTCGEKKLSRSVTWADEKINSSGSRRLCEVREMGNDIKKESEVGNTDVPNDEVNLRRSSAEACAIALSHASEAVASGGSDVSDAGKYCFIL